MNFEPETDSAKTCKNDSLTNYSEKVSSEMIKETPLKLTIIKNSDSTKKESVSSKKPKQLKTEKTSSGTHKSVFVQSDVLPTKFSKGKFLKNF